jgi:tetraacyldisaccharide 4'-kinase
VIRIGPDRVAIERSLPEHLPRIEAELRPGPAAPDLSGRRVVAFAGIGRPAKFFRSLIAQGAELVAAHEFPDHHPYRHHEIVTLLAAAERQGALCITTAKDLVRLPGDLRAKVRVLPVRLVWAHPEALDRLIEPALASRRINR